MTIVSCGTNCDTCNASAVNLDFCVTNGGVIYPRCCLECDNLLLKVNELDRPRLMSQPSFRKKVLFEKIDQKHSKNC